MTKLLLIGPRSTNQASGIGGTTISFESLLNHVRGQHQPHRVLSINPCSNQWLSALVLLLNTLWAIPRSDVVMLNVNTRGAVYLAPFIYRYTRLWRKHYVFRMFGGDLAEVYQARPPRGKTEMQKSIFSADIVYLQTQRLMDYFHAFSDKIRWLPTARTISHQAKPKPYSGKFVFISQVKQSKGVDLVIQLAESRPDLNVSIYGPILQADYDYLQTKDYYHGVLEPDQVGKALAKHDVLLLPTFHPGEGYPGIIIEAFAAGLPVIASRWLAIPELVEEGVTGILVEPRSRESLENAVDSVTRENHSHMSRQALAFVQQFNADTVNTRLLEDLSALSG